MPGDDPVIVIQAARSPTVLGWLAPYAWKNGREGGVNEITICAEHLARSVEGISETLLHEMVHPLQRRTQRARLFGLTVPQPGLSRRRARRGA